MTGVRGMKDGKLKGAEMRDSYVKKKKKRKNKRGREANKKANKQKMKMHVMEVAKGGGRVGKER